jgi:anti-sigma B factor antagonist
MRSRVRNLEGGITVLDYAGKLTLDRGATMLRHTLLDLLYAGHKRVILNFSEVTRVDCAGLGELVNLFKLAGQIGAELRLTNLSRRVKQVLHLTQLLSVFGDTPDEQSAVASLLKAPDTEMEEVAI